MFEDITLPRPLFIFLKLVIPTRTEVQGKMEV